MKTRHKILLVISLLLVITIIVCLVLIRLQSKGQTNVTNLQLSPTAVTSSPLASASVPSRTSTATANIANESGATRYVNSDYGFEISFPKSWGDVRAQVTDGEGVEKAILFSVKTSDPKYAQASKLTTQAGRATIITLYIFEGDNKVGTLLTKKNQRGFSYVTWEESPSDYQTITEKEIAEVLKTFRLTNT